jgi:flagellar biogenesis protein FliO
MFSIILIKVVDTGLFLGVTVAEEALDTELLLGVTVVFMGSKDDSPDPSSTMLLLCLHLGVETGEGDGMKG